MDRAAVRSYVYHCERQRPCSRPREATMAKKAKSSGKSNGTKPEHAKPRFRSQLWFDNPDDPGATALYFERYLNYGLTRGEIMGGKPIIGIAPTGSDLSPCN